MASLTSSQVYDLLLIVGCLVAGGIIGYKVSARYHMKMFTELMEELKIDKERLMAYAEEHGMEVGDDYDNDNMPEYDLVIVQDGAQLYAYRKDTKAFLGQAADPEALVERIAQDWRGVRFKIAEEDGAGLMKTPEQGDTHGT